MGLQQTESLLHTRALGAVDGQCSVDNTVSTGSNDVWYSRQALLSFSVIHRRWLYTNGTSLPEFWIQVWRYNSKLVFKLVVFQSCIYNCWLSAFSTFTLLVGRQDGHLACDNFCSKIKTPWDIVIMINNTLMGWVPGTRCVWRVSACPKMMLIAQREWLEIENQGGNWLTHVYLQNGHLCHYACV